jgi:hypothetical protein
VESAAGYWGYGTDEVLWRRRRILASMRYAMINRTGDSGFDART